MAIAFRASFLLNDNSANQPSSITGTLPASVQPGDVALLCVEQGTGINNIPTPPAGFTPLDGPTRINNNLTTWLFARKLTVTDAGRTVTVTASGGARFIGLGTVFSGAGAVTDIVVTVNSDTTAGPGLVSPNLTTPVANCELVNFWAVRAASATAPNVTAPGTHTSDGQVNTAFTTSPNLAIRASYRLAATVANWGGASASVAPDSTGIVYSVALTPAATNTAPTADAGPDQTAVEPWSQVTLNGTATDPDGTVVAQRWTQTGGAPTVTLNGDGPVVTFEAPPVVNGATLTFTFTATDNAGATGSDVVSVTILPVTERTAASGVLQPVQLLEVDTGNPPPPPPPPPSGQTAVGHAWTMWARQPDLSLGAALPITSAKFVKRHLGVATATATTPYSGEAWAALQPSCGLVLYRDGRQEFTGRLTAREHEWDAQSGRLLISLEAQGDERGLSNRPVFPDPLRAADDQTVNDYWRPTAGVPASTAMLQLISDQAGPTCRDTRQIPGLVLGDDPAVGVVRSWTGRYEKVLDLLAKMSVASGANLGLRVTSSAGELQFDIYAPRDVSQRIMFSADLGNLVGYKYRDEAPSVTDAVAGGKGDLHLRLQKKATTTDPLALQWGERLWSYVDRRDTDDVDELTQAAQDAVTEGAPTVSLTVTLTDTQAATYGRDWGLGDVVTVFVGPPGLEKPVKVTDVVREIAFEVASTGAETIRPAIGSFDAKATLPTPTQRQLALVSSGLTGLITRQ